MQAPINIQQVHSFIEAVTYYQDMWPCRLHILAQLADLTGKGTLNWTPVHLKAFDAMNALMVEFYLFVILIIIYHFIFMQMPLIIN